MQSIEWTTGDEIRKARLFAGMKQEELAYLVGVSRPLVSKWERNLSVPSIIQWRAISIATGVQLSSNHHSRNRRISDTALSMSAAGR